MDPVSILEGMAEMAYDGRHPSVSMVRAAAIGAVLDELETFRSALRDIEQFGHRNPGYGWSCANKASAALGLTPPKKGRDQKSQRRCRLFPDEADEPTEGPIQWSGERHHSASREHEPQGDKHGEG